MIYFSLCIAFTAITLNIILFAGITFFFAFAFTQIYCVCACARDVEIQLCPLRVKIYFFINGQLHVVWLASEEETGVSDMHHLTCIVMFFGYMVCNVCGTLKGIVVLSSAQELQGYAGTYLPRFEPFVSKKSMS
jgi:hypothetical protein